MKERRCINCRWFVHVYGSRVLGKCHLNPPSVMPESDKRKPYRESYLHIDVSGEDWCSHFKKKRFWHE